MIKLHFINAQKTNCKKEEATRTQAAQQEGCCVWTQPWPPQADVEAVLVSHSWGKVRAQTQKETEPAELGTLKLTQTGNSWRCHLCSRPQPHTLLCIRTSHSSCASDEPQWELSHGCQISQDSHCLQSQWYPSGCSNERLWTPLSCWKVSFICSCFMHHCGCSTRRTDFS